MPGPPQQLAPLDFDPNEDGEGQQELGAGSIILDQDEGEKADGEEDDFDYDDAKI